MTKVTQALGTLSGPVLIFGGVYSNLQALQALQAIAKEAGIAPHNIICTGDIVGYCAQPEEACQVVKKWGVHSILGNVEIQLRDEVDDCGCNFDDGSRCDRFSRQWFPYAQSQISADSLAWFRSLPDHLTFHYAGKRVGVVHGSAQETAEFVFESTDWAVKRDSLLALDVDIILAGHCGLPFQDARQNEGLWLNAGVIGMPANDGTPRVWYLLLNDEDGQLTFQHHPFTYAAEEARDRMFSQKLPASYGETLVTGLWDNCEILPEAETNLQGVAL